MSNHTYRVIEIVGTSPDGLDAAIRSGLARAAETMRGLDWFEVESIRGTPGRRSRRPLSSDDESRFSPEDPFRSSAGDGSRFGEPRPELGHRLQAAFAGSVAACRISA